MLSMCHRRESNTPDREERLRTEGLGSVGRIILMHLDVHSAEERVIASDFFHRWTWTCELLRFKARWPKDPKVCHVRYYH